jgi:threonine-phosphate decarboxylase
MRSVLIKESPENDDRLGVAHGGRVYEAARRWGISPAEVLDFSSNINPLGTPPGVHVAIRNSVEPVNLRAYPDTHAFTSALADRQGVTPAEVVVGNGTAALMFAVLRALLPKRVLVHEPAFGEYLRACAAVKAEATRWTLSEEDNFTPDFNRIKRALEKRRFDLVILNSPHNPTGNLYAKDELLRLFEGAEVNGVAVMLDEAFTDFAPPQSSLLRSAAEKTRLVVLRSLTKFYAMPALRVGYAVCGEELAAAVREHIEAWPVSTVALEVGRAALYEAEFEEYTRRVNAQAREEFACALRGAGLKVFPSAANFLLARLPHRSGKKLSDWLEQHRILIRKCGSFGGLGDEYVRLAVRLSQDNLRLVSLIKSWLKRRREMNKSDEV